MTKAHAEVDVVRSFFGSLWEEDPAEDTCLVLWGGKGGAQRRCRTLDEAAQGAAWLAQRGQECYYGVALQDVPAMEQEARRRVEAKMPKAVGPELTRGYVSTAAAIPGLWLDIDIEGDGHAKKGLPTWADVDQILAPLPEPTFRAATGGGLHVYWLFREPWYFDGPEERDRAATLLRRWQRWAAGQGFALDSANDLARVLRPVGAWTSKRGRLVELMGGDSFDGPRYNPSDLEELAERFAPATREVEASKPGSTFHVQQVPIRPVLLDDSLLERLHQIPGFSPIWAGKAGKESDSENDFALARFGVEARLTDDEIAGLMIEWGRQHRKNPLKVDRLDYVGGTIGKARAWWEARQAETRTLQEAQQTLRRPDPPKESDLPSLAQERARQAALDVVGQLLGLKAAGMKLERVLIHPADEGTSYTLVISGRRCAIPGGALIQFQTFSRQVSPAINYVLTPIKGEDWLNVARTIQAAAVVEDLADAGNLVAMAPEWVERYVASAAQIGLEHEHSHPESVAESMRSALPFPRGGAMWFSLEALTEWVRTHGGGTVATYQMARALKLSGYDGERLGLPGSNVRRRFWGPRRDATAGPSMDTDFSHADERKL